MAEDIHGMFIKPPAVCGADIAKDIRARVSDLNELVKAAYKLGLRVEYDIDDGALIRTLGEPPAPRLTAYVLQPL